MKKIISLVFVLVLGFSLLTACSKKQEKAPDSIEATPPVAEMTEEQRIAEMIKLIEAEEAKMKAAGEQ